MIVSLGWRYSSDIYRIFNEGKARNNKIKAGKVVQKYSSSWFSEKNRLKKDSEKIDIKFIKTENVNINKIKEVWS